MTALVVILALVAVSTALGLLWRARQGRVRLAHGEAADLAQPGASVTLLQLSTEVCAPCRATHAVLERVADDRGIAHIDLDITHRPEVAQRFRVLTTPTTLVLDAQGAVRARITGAARSADVIRTLDDLIGAPA